MPRTIANNFLSSEHTQSAGDAEQGLDWSWYWRGTRNVFSIPALVLFSAFVGYGSVTSEAGIDVLPAMFSVFTIWALPSNLIVIAGIVSGASIFAIAIAVALASIRLFPMTLALIPDIRHPKARVWQQMAASCFIAVTAWVHMMNVGRDLPREARLPYFVGFASVLMLGCTVLTGITHTIAGRFPDPVMASFYALTPLYFLISIWRSSGSNTERFAMILGFVIGPPLISIMPQGGVILAGLLGGGFAYALRRVLLARKGQGA